MSLFDQLKNSLLDQSGVPASAEHSALATAAMQIFGNQHSLSGLAQGFERAGLGQAFASWIGTGTNQPISGEHVQSVVGQEKIEEFAQKAGIPPSVAPQLLATVLPMLIDRLTPAGRLPKSDAEIQQTTDGNSGTKT